MADRVAPRSGYRTSQVRCAQLVTEVLVVDAHHPDRVAIAHAAAILRDGGLVAFPTETVYGLGAHALDRNAVRRIFDAKRRPPSDPLIVHVHGMAALTELAIDIPPEAHALASRFWPGPLTLVLRKSPIVPDEVTAGLDTVAIRMPAHPVAHALLAAAAVPVAAPSANLFSRPSPTRASHVLQDLDGRIDLVIDGGPTAVGVESTVLDLTTAPAVLRPGAVTLEMIRTVVPAARLRDRDASDDAGAMKSPGQLSRHYSPRAPLTLYEGTPHAVAQRIVAAADEAIARGLRVGIIAADDDTFPAEDKDAVCVERLGPESDLNAIAANLYHALRRLDDLSVDVIFARTFSSSSGLGVAVHDRLRRAAAGRVVRADG
jgi:L-threonylcarbamoyladenylate synthase